MAKAGQKRKKAERAKKQLKSSMKAAGKADKKKKVKGQSGIRLPKGLNEVKPEVKTKAISVVGKAAPLARQELLATGKEEPEGIAGKRYRPIKVRFISETLRVRNVYLSPYFIPRTCYPR